MADRWRNPWPQVSSLQEAFDDYQATRGVLVGRDEDTAPTLREVVERVLTERDSALARVAELERRLEETMRAYDDAARNLVEVTG